VLAISTVNSLEENVKKEVENYCNVPFGADIDLIANSACFKDVQNIVNGFFCLKEFITSFL
jgi:hypothetical protein